MGKYRSIFLFGLLFFLSENLLAGDNPGSAAANDTRHSIGVVVGIPQIIGLTYDYLFRDHLSLRAHAGSLYIISSAGLRLQYEMKHNWFQPYFFSGVAFIDFAAQDYGDPDGTTGYLWVGPGLNLNLQRFIIFTEVSGLIGGDKDKGLGADWFFPFNPSIAGGILFRF